MDIKQIRAAVEANHGGFDQASDDQVMRLWDSLPTDVQARYTKAEHPNDRNGPKPAPRIQPGDRQAEAG